MYQNIKKQNQKKPYLNGKPNFNPEKHEIKKAPIERLLTQNTLPQPNAKYQTSLNVYPTAVELVRNHLEDQIKQIALIAAPHALNKGHRTTVMPEDIKYALQKISRKEAKI